MILRYGVDPDDDEPLVAKRPSPLVVGERYEVAEIYEWPWHLMARRPGEGRWPVPGEGGFGLPADEFEPTDEAIPIVRSGYVRCESLMHFFGAILTAPEHIRVIRTLGHVAQPHDWEVFDQWYARAFAEYERRSAAVGESFPFPPEVAESLFKWTREAPRYWEPVHGVVDEAMGLPQPLKVPFAYVGVSPVCNCCRECDAAKLAVVQKHLRHLLDCMGARKTELRDYSFSHWERAEEQDGFGEGSPGDEEVEGEEEGRGEDGVW